MSELPPSMSFAEYYGLRSELKLFLSRRLANAADVEDLSQEALIRWLGTTPDSGYSRPLLFRIARNLMYDHWRRQQVRTGAGLVRLDEDDSEADEALQTEGPLAMIEQQQRLSWLAEALAALPPKRKQAFVLHKFDGLTQTAVAQKMGISLSMVEKHIAGAMLHCKRFAALRSRQKAGGHDAD